MVIIFQKREKRMSIIKDIRSIYSNMETKQTQQTPTPVNPELMSAVNSQLNKQPQIAPNITRKDK